MHLVPDGRVTRHEPDERFVSAFPLCETASHRLPGTHPERPRGAIGHVTWFICIPFGWVYRPVFRLTVLERSGAHMTVAAAPICESLQRITSEYLEMPGLRLTPNQVHRLCGVELDRCEALLGALVDAKFLDRTRDGAFVRYNSHTAVQRFR